MAYSTLGWQIMSTLKVSGLTEDYEIPPRSKLKQTHALTARAWLGPPLYLRESMAQAFAALALVLPVSGGVGSNLE